MANSLSEHDASIPGSDSPIQLTNLFECPVCYEYILPPILQCESGHLVCSKCHPKLGSCPSCRRPLGNVRNLAMEKVAEQVTFPCKYAFNGCPEKFFYPIKENHEDSCLYRPYLCPCPGTNCTWQGGVEDVLPHLKSSHTSITNLQGDDIVFLATDIDLPGAVDWVMMQSCFDHNFMLVLEKHERAEGFPQFFAVVLVIGSQAVANQFMYRLELAGNAKKLTWEARPRSVREGIHSIIQSCDCLVFEPSHAKHFDPGNGNLAMNVVISMKNCKV